MFRRKKRAGDAKRDTAVPSAARVVKKKKNGEVIFITHSVYQSQFIERDPIRYEGISECDERTLITEHELFGRLFDDRIRTGLGY